MLVVPVIVACLAAVATTAAGFQLGDLFGLSSSRQIPRRDPAEHTKEVLEKTHNWLRTPSCRQQTRGWTSDEAHRRVIALAFTDSGFFDSCSLESLLHVRDLEQQLLLQEFGSEAAEDDRGQLALHVLALTLSCQRPVDAKGRDLALMLRDRPSRDGKRNRFSEAIQLLALCALGDRGRSLEDAALKNIVFLVQKSTAAVADSLAANGLALMCLTENRTDDLPSAFLDSLQQLARMQQPDGSFGNIHTSALITQVLMAAENRERLPWSKSRAMNFILESQEEAGHFGNLLATFQVAPLLAGKTLASVASHARTFCTSRSQMDVQTHDSSGSNNASVWYSLWVGNSATNRSSTTVSVPRSATLFHVMQKAAEKDDRFRFEYRNATGLGPYVTSLSGVPQDAAASHYWMAHVMDFVNSIVTPLPRGVASHVVQDLDHVIMWYKKVDI